MNEKIKDWKLTVGLEVHIQLSTKSKMFCKCSYVYGSSPNSLTCPVCLGLPGALPVINQEAINMAIKLGHALDFSINQQTEFSRKNYYYPDLPKGYQITQFDKPICENGHINIEKEGKVCKIDITRAHLEEDSGKLIHHSDNFSFIDLNRAGCPLIEIVSEPQMHSSEDAKLYLEKLKQIVKYINISDCNMEKGNLRVDINVSVNKDGDSDLGTRREIKNLNSFRSVQKAINYEYKKQIELIEGGQKLEQSTLLWDEKNNKTKVIRKKEDAHDYRYFPEPDLPKLNLSSENLDVIKNQLPELPDEKFDRFSKTYDVKEQDLNIIISDSDLSIYFEDLVKLTKLPQQTANWLLGEMLRYTKEQNIEINQFPISQDRIAELIILYSDNQLTNTNAKKIFTLMLDNDKNATELMVEKGLKIIDDDDFVENTIKSIFEKNPDEFTRLKNGESKLGGFFMGQVMKEVKGKANPKIIQDFINKYIGN